MENQAKTEKILDRVRKMLALGNDSAASEAERDTALTMAHNLLAKYNLTMLDAEAHGQKVDDPRDKFNQQGYSFQWALSLNQSVAKLFFCYYYVGEKINTTQCKHYFVGKESNATTAMYMATHVVTSILKECRKRFSGSITSPEARSFAIGATDRLRQRINQMIKDAETTGHEGTPGTALMLVNLYKSELMENEKLLPSTLVSKKARTSSVNGAAYGAGKEFGNSVGLSLQVGAAPKAKPLRIR